MAECCTADGVWEPLAFCRLVQEVLSKDATPVDTDLKTSCMLVRADECS